MHLGALPCPGPPSFKAMFQGRKASMEVGPREACQSVRIPSMRRDPFCQKCFRAPHPAPGPSMPRIPHYGVLCRHPDSVLHAPLFSCRQPPIPVHDSRLQDSTRQAHETRSGGQVVIARARVQPPARPPAPLATPSRHTGITAVVGARSRTAGRVRPPPLPRHEPSHCAVGTPLFLSPAGTFTRFHRRGRWRKSRKRHRITSEKNRVFPRALCTWPAEFIARSGDIRERSAVSQIPVPARCSKAPASVPFFGGTAPDDGSCQETDRRSPRTRFWCFFNFTTRKIP